MSRDFDTATITFECGCYVIFWAEDDNLNLGKGTCDKHSKPTEMYQTLGPLKLDKIVHHTRVEQGGQDAELVTETLIDGGFISSCGS